MKYVSIDQLDRADIERALDAAFAKVGTGHGVSAKQAAIRDGRIKVNETMKEIIAIRVGQGVRQVRIAHELNISPQHVSNLVRQLRAQGKLGEGK
jgi:DNA-directed RNA polymerase specialized sigma subunit